MTNAVAKSNLNKYSLNLESALSGPEAVKIINNPMIPNTTEADINIFVAIFCITVSLYHWFNLRNIEVGMIVEEL